VQPTSRPADSFPDPEVYGRTQVLEFLDPWHPRASVEASGPGAEVVVDPERVLDNITLALHRLDVDLDAPAPLGPDTLTENELVVMLAGPDRPAVLVAHVVNTAVRLMHSRYPLTAARAPFPDDYDLREVETLDVGDREHALARALFNQRLAGEPYLDPADLTPRLRAVDFEGHIRLLAALSVMFTHKLLALKHHTGQV
jgi:hypothetical protein